ncbi:hypothetical protein [Luteibacter sp. 9135]|uniref:hypothetical protein n=1 Tax=Luteibacter sp. 9135 TaxID=1500893 RepID=UPI00163AA9EE|nr:hypothetical protein [Luteibacter sp. 9135]
MKIWKSFFPGSDDVEILGAIKGGSYFIDGDNNPKWESVYFRSGNEEWIALTWNYFDIEFKFETFGISREVVRKVPTALLDVGSIPEFEKIDFCVRTEWTRPASPGEVPSHYEQVIEEAGRLAQVPADAISAGTSLYAIVFRSINGDSDVMISIDDNIRFSLKSVTGSAKIAAILQSCDVFTSAELLAWQPPL